MPRQRLTISTPDQIRSRRSARPADHVNAFDAQSVVNAALEAFENGRSEYRYQTGLTNLNQNIRNMIEDFEAAGYEVVESINHSNIDILIRIPN